MISVRPTATIAVFTAGILTACGPNFTPNTERARDLGNPEGTEGASTRLERSESVSYTHLTLPTILLV